MTARDPDDDVELSGCTAQLRSYVAGLEYSLNTAHQHAAQARRSASDAIVDRERASRERDAAARELAAVLADRDAPRTENPDGLDLARRAVELWGPAAQMDQTIEECAELILSIRHYRRERVGHPQVADEVIDVEWMCRQLRVIIGSSGMLAAEGRKMAKVIRKVTEAEAKRDGEVN